MVRILLERRDLRQQNLGRRDGRFLNPISNDSESDHSSSSEEEEEEVEDVTEVGEEMTEGVHRLLNRDIFSLPSLGLNYLNNLHLNLNLNLNLRNNLKNTRLWSIYENSLSSLNKPISAGNFFNNRRSELDEFEELWRKERSKLLDKKDQRDLEQLLDSKSAENLAQLDYEVSPRRKNIGERVRRMQRNELEALDSTKTAGYLHEGGDDGDAHLIPSNEGPTLIHERIVQPSGGKWPKIAEDFFTNFFGSSKGGEVVGDVTPQSHLPRSPFHHRVQLSLYDKIKIGLMTVTIFPIRVIGMFLSLLLAWILIQIGFIGLTFEESQARPLTRWRKNLRHYSSLIVMRTLFFFAGFHWVRYKGKRASFREAPILVVSPHSSYFDALPLILLGSPSVVAKSDVRKVPFFGKLVDFTQPVYVAREDPNSRQNCVQEIIRRSQGEEEWPQIFIYPEGTCTNRSCIVSFKAGAFHPGVPVQPVLIRYPNRSDTITWTFEGLPALRSIWLSLTQFHNSVELEFLPVYTPSEAEKSDFKLFAGNVQRVIADAYGVPATDYTYEDGLAICRMKSSSFTSKIRQIYTLRRTLGMENGKVELEILKRNFNQSGDTRSRTNAFLVDYINFTRALQIDENAPESHQLFNMFLSENMDIIDLREYILHVMLLHPAVQPERIIQLAYYMFGCEDNNGRGIRVESYTELMERILECSGKEIEKTGIKEKLMDFDEFKGKIGKRFEWAKLYALEESGMETLKSYPPREYRAELRPNPFGFGRCRNSYDLIPL